MANTPTNIAATTIAVVANVILGIIFQKNYIQYIKLLIEGSV